MCLLSRRYPLFYQKSTLNEYYELMECCSFFGSECVINGLKEMNRQVENIPYVEPAPLRELFLRSQWEEWMVDVAMDLLMKMVEINPLKRITAEEALKHTFFLMFAVCEQTHSFKDDHPIDFELACFPLTLHFIYPSNSYLVDMAFLTSFEEDTQLDLEVDIQLDLEEDIH